MNKHFPVINRRAIGTDAVVIIICIITILFSGFKFITEGGRQWLMVLIPFIIFIIIAIFVMKSLVNAGVVVVNNIVYLPNVDIDKIEKHQFNVNDIVNIRLKTSEGNTISENTDDLSKAIIEFTIEDKSKDENIDVPAVTRIETYEPFLLNKNEYIAIRDALQPKN